MRCSFDEGRIAWKSNQFDVKIETFLVWMCFFYWKSPIERLKITSGNLLKQYTRKTEPINHIKKIKTNETNPINDILSHTPHFDRKQANYGMVIIIRHQQTIACVRAGRGQPWFDCGRQLVQFPQRSMGYRQAYLECWGKRIVDTTELGLKILQMPKKNYIWLPFQFWAGSRFSLIP